MVYHELNSCGSITFDFLDLRIVAADRTDEPEIYLTPCSFVEDDLFIVTPKIKVVMKNKVT